MTSDPGYYKQAEFCGRIATEIAGDDADVLLLQGHLAHAMHRFGEMETVARKLVTTERPRWENEALLGDALMEQGKLAEAIPVYQRMIDLRPCLQTYARVANLRWLKGDLLGAKELMLLAVEASSSRDPESAAWAYARPAFYQLQGGESANAERSARRGLEFLPNYPAGEIILAKNLLTTGRPAEAVPLLQRASETSPLPETQWLLADAARAAGDAKLADQTEGLLRAHGSSEDARTFSLFLASRGEEKARAIELAAAELENRRDIFTHDAVAWAALATNDQPLAQKEIALALAEGTSEARLFYHAGKISLAGGRPAESGRLVFAREKNRANAAAIRAIGFGERIKRKSSRPKIRSPGPKQAKPERKTKTK